MMFFQGCKATGYFKQYFFLVNSVNFYKLEFDSFSGIILLVERDGLQHLPEVF